MCGIFGILELKDRSIPDRARLEETARILAHRGPDNTGIYADQGVGLVHTRLSLLDLTEGANQPMYDRGGRYVLVYNGEVYNFWELRRELEALGHQFFTRCDTEVVLNGCIEFGVSAFARRLMGMFAFGLWDREEHELTLVRDRFGIKPLSVLQQGDRVVFASEIKAMRPWVDLEPNRDAVLGFLAGFDGPTRDDSFFQDVRILAPGTVMKVRRDAGIERSSFFQLPEFWEPARFEELHARSPRQIVDELDERLTESVKLHLLADAPVGAFCSGGIDSSLVMAMAAKIHPNLAIFHANVKGPLSEYDAAFKLASHLGLDMKTVEVGDEDFVRYLPETMWHYEYPYSYHPNSVPFLLVAKLVREHGVKAVLSGEGSDECFLGYRSIAYTDLNAWYHRRLAKLRNVVQKVPRLGRALWPSDRSAQDMGLALLSRFESELDREQIREHVAARSGAAVHPRDYRTLEWLSYHLRTLLHRNDTLGMAASIEARFPFLDHDVVRFAVNMPYSTKVRRSLRSLNRSHPFIRDKWALREVANRYLPKVLSQRKKLGFPTDAYARTEIDDAYLQRSTIPEMFKLTKGQASYFIHASDSEYRVRLLFLDVWTRLFTMGQSIDEVQSALDGAVRVTRLAA